MCSIWAGTPPLTNTLYDGDNLLILREYVSAARVDQVYLDPPFNSSRHYNVLFKNERRPESAAPIPAFPDTWHPNAAALATYEGLFIGAK